PTANPPSYPPGSPSKNLLYEKYQQQQQRYRPSIVGGPVQWPDPEKLHHHHHHRSKRPSRNRPADSSLSRFTNWCVSMCKNLPMNTTTVGEEAASSGPVPRRVTRSRTAGHHHHH